MYILSVIPLTKIPRPAPQALNYFSAKKASVGGIVEVFLGRRGVLAVVLSCSTVQDQKQQVKKSPFSLKPLERVVNAESIIPRKHLELIIWTSTYFYSSLGLIAKSMLPQIFSRPTKKFLEEISHQDNVGFDPTLQGGVKPYPATSKIKPILYWSKHNEQKKISFYKKQVRATIKNRKSVLFLAPELYKIKYFQEEIASLKKATVVHGTLTAKAQYDIWTKSLASNTQLIIGTRSALTMPLRNLGLIIVDEEESPFYKSFDQQPYINAKDIALKLAELAGSKIILGSDLPSIESFWRSKTGEYELKESGIPSTRAKLGAGRNKNQESRITIIDMKEELKGGNYSIFSKELQTRLIDITKNKKQTILFINRRGLSTGLLCRDCGHIIKCPNCDVLMVFHNKVNGQWSVVSGQLICHHCGQKQTPPTVCPECESYRIKFIGAGTQKAEQELNKLFSENKISTKSYQITRLDGDIAPNWEQQKKILDDFKRGGNILIGTQLMLKKILLPKKNLVSIITIDPLLSLPDFRINEQAYKIVDKLKTLTLSDNKGGVSTIILQTYIADSDVIKNIDANVAIFFKNELANRKELSLPPFSQIIKLVYAHKNPQKAEQEAQILKNKLLTQLTSYQLPVTSYQLLGPAPAYIPRVKNSYIWQILIKSKIKDLTLRNKILRVVPSDWKIDVDPIAIL